MYTILGVKLTYEQKFKKEAAYLRSSDNSRAPGATQARLFDLKTSGFFKIKKDKKNRFFIKPTKCIWKDSTESKEIRENNEQEQIINLK